MDLRDRVVTDVDAAAGAALALDPDERGATIAAVLHRDGEGALADFVFGDVALLLEDLGDVELELGQGQLGAVVVRERSIPEPGEHVSDGIGHHGEKFSVTFLGAA